MHKLQLKKKKNYFNTQDKFLLFSPPHTFTPTPHPPPYFCLSSLTLLTLSLILFSPLFLTSCLTSFLLSFLSLILFSPPFSFFMSQNYRLHVRQQPPRGDLLKIFTSLSFVAVKCFVQNIFNILPCLFLLEILNEQYYISHLIKYIRVS